MHYAAMVPGHSTGPAVLRRAKGRAVAMFRRSVVIRTGGRTANVPTVFTVLEGLGIALLIIVALIGLAALMPQPDTAMGPANPVPLLGFSLATAAATNKAGKSADKKVKQVVHTAEVIRAGEALVIPEGMSYEAVRKLLAEKEQAEEAPNRIHRHFKGVFPLEGALAFHTAHRRQFGIDAVSLESKKETLPIGPGETVDVPFGIFKFLGSEVIPGTGGLEHLTMGFHEDTSTGQFCLCVGGHVKGKHMDMITRFLDAVEQVARTESIYRGKAMKMSWTDRSPFGDSGAALPHIEFLDMRHVDPKAMVYNQDVEDIISANIFGHIQNRDKLAAMGVPFKMGALFAGKYGTGKSLLARAIGKVATDAGVTFIYLKNSQELERAYEFAMQYQPAVIFAEDIDAVLGGDDDEYERSQAVTGIVNLLDGIDSKEAQVMTILTTNHLSRINKVLLRPGRVDLAIHIEMPDAEAVGRLFWLYGGKHIDPRSDLTDASRMLAGQTPAVIREVIERAKRYMMAREGLENWVTQADIELSARTVVKQAQLIEGEQPEKVYTPAEAVIEQGKSFERGMGLVALAIADAAGAREDFPSDRELGVPSSLTRYMADKDRDRLLSDGT